MTFSYDDGAPGDKRLAQLFNKCSVKATFHTDISVWVEKNKEDIIEITAGNTVYFKH